ncbi:MAG: hypothetical protein IJL85_01260 [Erysipelotrichaceae bacterium]|nr:hypothetical protein [Erysipelotrichaceae bacterium]
MKAILIVDMPKSCEDCHLRFSGEPNEWCWYLRHGLDDITSKPSWCPLRPMPKLKEPRGMIKSGGTITEIYDNDEDVGYNKALYEIMGETE